MKELSSPNIIKPIATRTKNEKQSLTPLIAESERVISEAIRHFKLKIPASALVLTIQTSGRRRAIGWFWANGWQNGKKDAIHEINLSAEWLRDHDMGETLLHELAHAENRHNGVKDCSGSQCHNKHFKAMAKRLGLEVKPRDQRCGYGFTALAAGGEAFLNKIAFKRELFNVFRLTIAPKEKVGSRLVKIECSGCGYVARTTQRWLQTGLPTCPCGEQFTCN